MKKIFSLLAILVLVTASVFWLCRPYYYCHRGIPKEAKGDLDGAITDDTKAIEIKPDYAFAYNNRGIAKDAKGDLDGAITDYTKAIEINPDFADAYANRGKAKHENGDLDAAMTDCNKAIELNPDFAKAYNSRGYVKENNGDLDGAMADYNKAIELDPNYYRPYNNRGNLKENQGDLNGAMADYNKTIELNPHFFGTYFRRAVAKENQGDFNGAIADYTIAIEIKPNLVDGYFDNSDSAKKAKGNYTKAIALKCDLASFYDGRGWAEETNGDYGDAIDDYTKAIELNPDASAYQGRGSSKNCIGDFDGAITDDTKAIEIDPDFTDAYHSRGIAYNNRGYLKVEHGNLDDALADFNKVFESYPEYGRGYYNRGCVYYDLREFTNALADFRKSCVLSSQRQDDSFFHVWLVRARLGEKEAATKELQAYWDNRKTGTPDDWPSKISSFLAGQLAEPDFLKAAENADKQKDSEQHCEAFFYAGSKRLIEGDKITATDYFEKCRPTDVKSFSEYRSAAAELQFLKAEK